MGWWALRSVAVLGPNANLSEAMAGYYGPALVCGGRFTSAVDAVRDGGGTNPESEPVVENSRHRHGGGEGGEGGKGGHEGGGHGGEGEGGGVGGGEQ